MTAPFQVTFDCLDPQALADFWAGAIGYVPDPAPPGFATWEDFLREQGVPSEDWAKYAAVVPLPGFDGPRLYFQKVPERKTAKNRMHLDLPVAPRGTPSEDRRTRLDQEIARLVTMGAVVVGPVTEHGDYWVVMQDPEGNEFCVY
jgi:hypothetical protein